MASGVRRRNQPHSQQQHQQQQQEPHDYYSLPDGASLSITPTDQQQKPMSTTWPAAAAAAAAAAAGVSFSATMNDRDNISRGSRCSIGGDGSSSSSIKRFMSTKLLATAPEAVAIQSDENEEESPISVDLSSPSFKSQVFFSHSIDEEDAQIVMEPSQSGGCGMTVQLCGGPFATTTQQQYYSNDNDDMFVTMGTKYTATTGSCTVRIVTRFWNDTIQKYHALILLLVVFIIWPLGFYYSSSFSTTKDTFSSMMLTPSPPPPQYSPSAKALDALRRNYFNHTQNHHRFVYGDNINDGWRHDPSHPPIYVILKATTPTTTTASLSSSSLELPFDSLTRPDTDSRQAAHDFLNMLNQTIHQYCFHHHHLEDEDNNKNSKNHASHHDNTNKCLDPNTWLRITSYYSLLENDKQLSWLARTTLASPGGKHVIMKFEYKYNNKAIVDELMQVIQDFILQQQYEHHEHQHLFFTAHVTGIPFLQQDLINNVQAISATMVTWLAVSLLLVCSVVMMLILVGTSTPTNLRTAQSSSSSSSSWELQEHSSSLISVMTFIVMVLVTFWTTTSIERVIMHHFVSSDSHDWTSIIMSCLTFGMSIKYTMILLNGYVNANTNHQPKQQEQQQCTCMIGHMLETTVPDLVFSNVAMMMIIAASYYYSGLFLPPFQSVAIGVMVAMKCTLMVHLTLVPAMLYAAQEGVGRGSLFWQHQSSGWWNLFQTTGQTTTTAPTTFSAAATTTTPLLLHHDVDDDDDDLDSPRMENGANDVAETASSIFRKQQQQQPRNDITFRLATSLIPVALRHARKRIVNDDDNKSTTGKCKTDLHVWHSWLSNHLASRGGAGTMVTLLVTLFILAPVAWLAKDIQSSLSINLDLLLPTNSPSLETLKDLTRQLSTMATTTSGSDNDSFGSNSAAGSPFMNPYQILFDGRAVGRKMASNEGFDIMQRVVDELMAIDRHPDEESDDDDEEEQDAEDHTTHIGMPLEDANHLFHDITVEMERVEKEEEWLKCAEDRRLSAPSSKRPTTFYNGIAVLHNTRIPYVMYSGGKLCMQIKRCPTKLMHVVAALDKLLTTRDEFGTIITATLGVDSFSNQGLVWLQEARATIERMQQGGALEGVEVYIHGTAAMTHDTANAVNDAFPFMIQSMICAVLLLTGVYFQSVFLTLLSLFTIGLTASFSFGLAALVIPNGFFLNMALGKNEICWLVPPLALCLIVGLSLEQNVLFSRRILRYRPRLGDGYNHQSCMATVTSSGVAMALTFGSLMLFSSTSPALKQLSFIITTAVLLDTFVIRPVIVPSLYDLAGPRFCWWPRHDYYSANHHHHHHHGAASKRRLSEYPF